MVLWRRRRATADDIAAPVSDRIREHCCGSISTRMLCCRREPQTRSGRTLLAGRVGDVTEARATRQARLSTKHSQPVLRASTPSGIEACGGGAGSVACHGSRASRVSSNRLPSPGRALGPGREVSCVRSKARFGAQEAGRGRSAHEVCRSLRETVDGGFVGSWVVESAGGTVSAGRQRPGRRSTGLPVPHLGLAVVHSAWSGLARRTPPICHVGRPSCLQDGRQARQELDASLAEPPLAEACRRRGSSSRGVRGTTASGRSRSAGGRGGANPYRQLPQGSDTVRGASRRSGGKPQGRNTRLVWQRDAEGVQRCAPGVDMHGHVGGGAPSERTSREADRREPIPGGARHAEGERKPARVAAGRSTMRLARSGKTPKVAPARVKARGGATSQ